MALLKMSLLLLLRCGAGEKKMIYRIIDDGANSSINNNQIYIK